MPCAQHCSCTLHALAAGTWQVTVPQPAGSFHAPSQRPWGGLCPAGPAQTPARTAQHSTGSVWSVRMSSLDEANHLEMQQLGWMRHAGMPPCNRSCLRSKTMCVRVLHSVRVSGLGCNKTESGPVSDTDYCVTVGTPTNRCAIVGHHAQPPCCTQQPQPMPQKPRSAVGAMCCQHLH